MRSVCRESTTRRLLPFNTPDENYFLRRLAGATLFASSSRSVSTLRRPMDRKVGRGSGEHGRKDERVPTEMGNTLSCVRALWRDTFTHLPLATLPDNDFAKNDKTTLPKTALPEFCPKSVLPHEKKDSTRNETTGAKPRLSLT